VTPVAIASDHAGFALKEGISGELRLEGFQVIDLGTHSTEPVDYPDYARAVGRAIQKGKAERGILVCGSGVGACVAANKMRGVRAGLCHDTYSARQGVEHDDMNVLCLGARVIGPDLARELVSAFLSARFSGEARHVRRLEKVREMEENSASSSQPVAGRRGRQGDSDAR
jgi:RpiB/LacA/LacB family sugar-phosphate isomerase